MSIGDRIRQLRKSKRLTQEQLAAAIGVERSSIGKYEGKSKNVVPSDDVKERLARFFNVSVDYLIGLSDIPYQIEADKQSPEERDLLGTYQQLTSFGRKLLLDYAHSLLKNHELRQEG